MALASAAKVYETAFLAGLKPDPLMTVDEWADEHRFLSSKSSAEPGRWRTSRTPYLKEPMQCLSPHSPVEQVVLMFSAQSGKTEAGLNWVGYMVDMTPGPMLMVQPTVDMAKRLSRQRLDPLFEESPRLCEKVRPARERDSGNTLLSKEFVGGICVMTGANSAVGLRSLPARYLFLDEIDGYPGDVDGEGDPINLAMARARTFARRKILLTSTPTIQGRSRVEAAYDDSDKRRYHVPCPYCNAFQVLEFKRLRWEPGQPKTVKYQCAGCENPIEEYHKTKMLEGGHWVAERPGVHDGKIVGFHLNGLYSPAGWLTWPDVVEQWERAKSNPDQLKGFINTILAETWQDRGEAPDHQRLYERREHYKLGEVPRGALFLTAGVDIQKDRLEVQIVGWGRGKESWSVDYRVFPGDTTTPEPWKGLEQLIVERFPHESGQLLPVRLMAIDTGFNTQVAYDWIRRQAPGRVVGVKGTEHLGQTIGQPSAVDLNYKGKRLSRGLKIWPLGVATIKSEFYAWLRQSVPKDGEAYPPGFCHFPEYGLDFFEQLTAEELIMRVIRGYSRPIWQKIRDRNEALDTWVYARAAASIVGMDRFLPETWDDMELELGAGVLVKAQAGTAKLVEHQPKEIARRKSSFWV